MGVLEARLRQRLDTRPGPAIEFFSFRSRRLKRIAVLPESAGRYPASDGYIAVSPEGQWFLYTQSDEVAEDIMLVDGFR